MVAAFTVQTKDLSVLLLIVTSRLFDYRPTVLDKEAGPPPYHPKRHSAGCTKLVLNEVSAITCFAILLAHFRHFS